MKHSLQITAILLTMFLVTQIIGLVVINAYTPRYETVMIDGVEKNISKSPALPYGMQPPEIKPEISLITIIFAFALFKILSKNL